MSNECPMCDKHTFFKTKKVLEMFDIGESTLDLWVKQGYVVKTLIGPKQVRFSQEDLQELIKRIPVEVK